MRQGNQREIRGQATDQIIDQHLNQDKFEEIVPSRLLCTRRAERIGTWNVRTLQGLGKMERLAREMEQYRLAVLAVTETHLPGEGRCR